MKSDTKFGFWEVLKDDQGRNSLGPDDYFCHYGVSAGKWLEKTSDYVTLRLKCLAIAEAVTLAKELLGENLADCVGCRIIENYTVMDDCCGVDETWFIFKTRNNGSTLRLKLKESLNPEFHLGTYD